MYLFTFLALTSMVAVWRDIGNAQLSLATAWNVTNTFALGVFLLVALQEAHRNRRPVATRARVGTDAAPRLSPAFTAPSSTHGGLS